MLTLETYADDHHGLITRAVATNHGISRAAWYRAVSDGRLELIGPGVARMPGSPRTKEQAIAAAVLCVAGSLASHCSAAHLWGSRDRATTRST